MLHTQSFQRTTPIHFVEIDTEVPQEISIDAGFIHTVIFSSEAFALIRWRPGEDSKKHIFEPSEDRLWNVLWMAQLAIRANPDAEETMFAARLMPKVGGGQYPEIARFSAKCTTTIDGRPAVKIDLA